MNSNLKSFTLIELLIVIAIIGIISGFIISGMNNSTKTARDAKRTAEINILTTLIVAYGSGNGSYPTTPQYLSCCVGGDNTVNNKNGECTNFNAILVGSTIPKDPLLTSSSTSSREWCYMYHSDGTQFSLSAKLENKGAISINSPNSLIIKEPNKVYTNCPTGYIPGPGFCVMQYEAKESGTTCTGAKNNHCAVSQSSGTPWVNISYAEAISTCQASGAHLITNAEWMALAKDIESVSSNWQSGNTNRGNSNSSAIQDGSSQYGTGYSDFTHYRIHTISNGQTIWDLAGNAYEWVDETISGSGSQPQAPAPGEQEINAVTNWGNSIGYTDVGPSNKSLTSSNGIGRIHYTTASDTRVFTRGGNFGSGITAGVWGLNTTSIPTGIGGGFGFRCAK